MPWTLQELECADAHVEASFAADAQRAGDQDGSTDMSFRAQCFGDCAARDAGNAEQLASIALR
jgi:hypothetical protein